MPTYLNEDILHALERRWDDLGTTMRDRMEPGLDDGAIDRIMSALDLRLPEEARRVFRWHASSGLTPLVLHRTLSPLSRCVEDTLDFRADDDAWRPTWLSFMDERPYIALDCGVADDAPVPVWHYDHAQRPPTRPMFESLGDFLLFWIELIDQGHMYWDAPSWKVREPLPPQIAHKIGGVPSD